MSFTSTEAFVLKGFRYGDTSKIVTLFSNEYGKFNAIVKGARNFKSRFSGIFENMNYINVFLNKKDNRELQLISKAEFRNSFPKIKTNLDKINTAYRILELLNKSTLDYYVNDKIFLLIKYTFETLENSLKNFNYFVLYFQINLAKLLGLGTLIEENQNQIFENNDYVKETFYKNLAFKLNKRHYLMIDKINSVDIDQLQNLSFDNNDIQNLQSNFDYILSDNLQNFGYLKTKKIINEINKNT